MTITVWRRSSRSDNGTSAQCVEVAEFSEGDPRD
ncbi:DUF397 domain-containing protein [Actinomadura sp. DC4]